MNTSENCDIRKEELLRILQKRDITTVFQPIVSLRNGTVYGYEALTRGPLDSVLHLPDDMFESAEKYEKIWELELLCRSVALETFSHLDITEKLFLNVNPLVMNDAKFKEGFTKELLNARNIDSKNIIFEITERGAVHNINEFINVIDHYKKQEYQIAIDDAGAGYSGLNMISDIHPHFLKLDMKLVRKIDKDTVKQALIKGLLQFATLTNTFLIAEGIETEKELLKLIELGVHYGQGFYLQKPCAAILPLKEEITQLINVINAKKNQLLDRKITDLFICNISYAQKSLSSKILISQVYSLMEEDKNISGFCITDAERLIGVITRTKLYQCLSGQYGYSLYGKKTVDKIMCTDFLQVDYHESVEEVAKLAMAREPEKLYDFITIVCDEHYYGIVTVKDLLEKTIQVRENNAKHLNPLSELPGNIIIEKKLEESLAKSEKKAVLYFDMNDFKAYNDVYGFENGDKVLRLFSQILKKRIYKSNDFIGHIGGDDFMAVVEQEEADALCQFILDDFTKLLPDFYTQADLIKGFITTKNRHGIEEDFPLLSIAIAGVLNQNFQTVYQLAESASKIKKLCKQSGGNHYLLCLE